jgi:hypothetical protein
MYDVGRGEVSGVDRGDRVLLLLSPPAEDAHDSLFETFTVGGGSTN